MVTGPQKSVPAHQTLNKHQTSDNDRLASPFFFDDIALWQDRSRTFTQEVSLAATTGARLEWDAGTFYLCQHTLQNIFETTIPAASALVLPDGAGVKFQTDSRTSTPAREKGAFETKLTPVGL